MGKVADIANLETLVAKFRSLSTRVVVTNNDLVSDLGLKTHSMEDLKKRVGRANPDLRRQIYYPIEAVLEEFPDVWEFFNFLQSGKADKIIGHYDTVSQFAQAQQDYAIPRSELIEIVGYRNLNLPGKVEGNQKSYRAMDVITWFLNRNNADTVEKLMHAVTMAKQWDANIRELAGYTPISMTQIGEITHQSYASVTMFLKGVESTRDGKHTFHDFLEIRDIYRQATVHLSQHVEDLDKWMIEQKIGLVTFQSNDLRKIWANNNKKGMVDFEEYRARIKNLGFDSFEEKVSLGEIYSALKDNLDSGKPRIYAEHALNEIVNYIFTQDGILQSRKGQRMQNFKDEYGFRTLTIPEISKSVGRNFNYVIRNITSKIPDSKNRLPTLAEVADQLYFDDDDLDRLMTSFDGSGPAQPQRKTGNKYYPITIRKISAVLGQDDETVRRGLQGVERRIDEGITYVNFWDVIRKYSERPTLIGRANAAPLTNWFANNSDKPYAIDIFDADKIEFAKSFHISRDDFSKYSGVPFRSLATFFKDENEDFSIVLKRMSRTYHDDRDPRIEKSALKYVEINKRAREILGDGNVSPQVWKALSLDDFDFSGFKMQELDALGNAINYFGKDFAPLILPHYIAMRNYYRDPEAIMESIAQTSWLGNISTRNDRQKGMEKAKAMFTSHLSGQFSRQAYILARNESIKPGLYDNKINSADAIGMVKSAISNVSMIFKIEQPDKFTGK